MKVMMILLVLVSRVLADEPTWDGATLTIEKNGKVQRYKLVSAPDEVSPATQTTFHIRSVDPTVPALVTVNGLDLGLDLLTTEFEWDFGDPRFGQQPTSRVCRRTRLRQTRGLFDHVASHFVTG
ncbi:MAG: hypothetical protein KatS3mg104_2036 [Phycisphaerae bacterium]|nr:MAG: hypothetical protein KatS3mg104_2036 [Phycisphaerae bacterium]